MNSDTNLSLVVFGNSVLIKRSLIEAIAVIILTLLISYLTQRWLDRKIKKSKLSDPTDSVIYKRTCRLIVWIIGLIWAFSTAGVNLNAIFATGGLFAIGLGFAFKNFIENLISGVAIKLDRTIRPGDIIKFDDYFVKIVQISFRATRALTPESSDLMIPNSTLYRSTVNNLTHHGSKRHRIGIEVGVAYSSDMAQVREVLETTAATLEWRIQSIDPWIVLTGFGSSAVSFEAYVWIDDPWFSKGNRSLFYDSVWRAFKDAGIVIAYPQLDVHLDGITPPPQS
jgi:potassium efflux system protein